MDVVAKIFVGLVAVIHIYILVLEMFLWRTPRARKAFGTTAEFADATAVLAANQGLYNGFLAAGLIFGLVVGGAAAFPVTVFFLACVIIAGLYGAATASKRIIFVQALPAAIALLFVLLAH